MARMCKRLKISCFHQSLAINYIWAGGIVAHPTKQPSWTKPPAGMLKLYVDASFSYEDGSTTCGAFVRRRAGRLQASRAMSRGATSNPFTDCSSSDGNSNHYRYKADLGLGQVLTTTQIV